MVKEWWQIKNANAKKKVKLANNKKAIKNKSIGDFFENTDSDTNDKEQ